MKKGIVILALLILALFSVSCVCASDVDDAAIASEDAAEIEIAQSDVEIVGEENDLNALGADTATFNELYDEIYPGRNVTLTHKYYKYDGSGQTINITVANTCIDGNGAVVDMAGSNYSVFVVSASGVTIKNLTIKNANSTDWGGAIFWSAERGLVSNCTFINNTARVHGGAISWYRGTGNVSNCNFINNTARVHGGAIFWSGWAGNVYGCSFIRNHADLNGGAIYWSMDGGSVSDCTFLSNTGNNDWVIFSNEYLSAVNCWFGNTAANYQNSPKTFNVLYNPILFLNATANPDTLYVSETSKIIFKLYMYNSTSGNISEYDNIQFKNLDLAIASTNGDVSEKTAKLDEGITYTAAAKGAGSVTATIEDVTFSVNLNAVKRDLNLVVTCDPVIYGQSAFITVTGFGNATGEVLAYVGDGVWGPIDVDHQDSVNFTVPDMIQNISGRIDYIDHDGRHNDANVNFDVIILTATEIESSQVTTSYNSGKYLVATLKDDKGNPIAGAKLTIRLSNGKTFNPTTDENGQVKVSTNGLAPNTYTVSIAFDGDLKYGKSTKDVKVTVKKATPKITAKAKTFKSSVKTKKFTITLKDGAGKTIKNAKVTLKVKGKTFKATTNAKGQATFKITKLTKKGTYNAVVTYKGDKNYNKATKKAKITIKAAFKTVSKGSKDKATVKKIQQALKNNGYYLTYKGHYLMVDGIFESCTERSVREFQHDNGLKVTGKVDEKTAQKLKII